MICKVLFLASICLGMQNKTTRKLAIPKRLLLSLDNELNLFDNIMSIATQKNEEETKIDIDEIKNEAEDTKINVEKKYLLEKLSKDIEEVKEEYVLARFPRSLVGDFILVDCNENKYAILSDFEDLKNEEYVMLPYLPNLEVNDREVEKIEFGSISKSERNEDLMENYIFVQDN